MGSIVNCLLHAWVFVEIKSRNDIIIQQSPAQMGGQITALQMYDRVQTHRTFDCYKDLLSSFTLSCVIQFGESAVELAYSYHHDDIVDLLMASRDKVLSKLCRFVFFVVHIIYLPITKLEAILTQTQL